MLVKTLFLLLFFFSTLRAEAHSLISEWSFGSLYLADKEALSTSSFHFSGLYEYASLDWGFFQAGVVYASTRVSKNNSKWLGPSLALEYALVPMLFNVQSSLEQEWNLSHKGSRFAWCNRASLLVLPFVKIGAGIRLGKGEEADLNTYNFHDEQIFLAISW